ncbi:MAG: glycosyltransferase family 2 protein [Candidatus Wallbacteria bacterium]|nr:glycosyltransferase family 2 protein [Candidatus Wallbacteria bacterium]
MKTESAVYILLPAYNEEKSLDRLLPKIASAFSDECRQKCHVIVCNDGSSDQTGEILLRYQQKMPLTVITHIYNRGLGETSRDLFEKAAELSTNDDFIVRLDCDDTHEPVFIRSMIEKLEQGFDVVIASRFQPGGGQKGVSTYRKLISWLANKFMKLCFPIRGINEYSCGFRAYRASVIKKAIAVFGNNFIQLKGLGFTCTLEKIVKLMILGARFSEVPFVLKYNQKLSNSKMVTSITTFGYFTLALLYHWPWGGWKSLYRGQRL